MSRQPDLHPSLAETLQLHFQPIKLERSRLATSISTSVDRLVGVIPKDGVETDDGERVWNDLDGEIGTTLEDVVLFGRDEGCPDAK